MNKEQILRDLSLIYGGDVLSPGEGVEDNIIKYSTVLGLESFNPRSIPALLYLARLIDEELDSD